MPLNLSPTLAATGLLILSNVFMTFAWYAHLRNLSGKPWFIAALASWGIALFEYPAEAGLSVGGAVHGGSGLVHVPRRGCHRRLNHGRLQRRWRFPALRYR